VDYLKDKLKESANRIVHGYLGGKNFWHRYKTYTHCML